ncbi:MAG: type II secretion system F family protein [Balneolaceae bacterium]
MGHLPPALVKATYRVNNRTHSGSETENIFAGLTFNQVTDKTVIDFTRGFAVMLKARLSLVQALDTAIQQETNIKFKKILKSIVHKVKGGHSLSASLTGYPGVFDSFYIHLVEVGEMAGILDEVLLRLADFMSKRYTLRKKIKLALLYPGMVLGVAAGAILFLLLVIVPTFADMYRDFNAELPELTQFVLSASNWFSENFLLLTVATGMMFFGGTYLLRKQNVRYLFDQFILKVPLIGTLLQSNMIIRFCQTLGTLLKSGITMTDSLSIISKASGNLLVKRATEDILRAVKKGGSLGKAVKRSRIFPPIVLQMITVGEETAELDRMLLHVSDHFSEEVDLKVDSLTSILEPLLIIILGLIIGFLIVAMYLPMFELMNVMG